MSFLKVGLERCILPGGALLGRVRMGVSRTNGSPDEALFKELQGQSNMLRLCEGTGREK